MSTRIKRIMKLVLQKEGNKVEEDYNIESEVDDSDRDLDFLPNEEDLSDSDYEETAKRRKVEKVKKNLNLTKKSVSSEIGDGNKENEEIHPHRQDIENEGRKIMSSQKIVILENRLIGNILSESQADKNNSNELEEETNAEQQTANKTKKRSRTKKDRIQNMKVKHPFCAVQCNCKGKKCSGSFSEEERQRIYEQYWTMDKQEQRIWLSHHVEEKKAKRKVEGSRRNFSRTYLFSKNTESVSVCQKFFLSTLGYTGTSVIDFLMKALKDDHGTRKLIPAEDKRGRHVPSNKINISPIKPHINSFQPKPSHYRRAHAPNRKYLAADLTIKDMCQDFIEKSAEVKVSYEKYRTVVDDMNIGFYNVEADKCGFCIEKDMNPSEENERLKELHLDQVRKTRYLYRKDSESSTEGTKMFAADLQKVFLLPRMPKVKDSFFTSRLIVFNETFTALSNQGRHYCILWHEALAGRRAEDVSCAFLKLLELNRDTQNIVLWLDNCSGQNKNNIFFSTLLMYVNSTFCSTQTITLNYLVSGHTYMAADGLHGKIEQAARRQGNIEDFRDFHECCQKASKRMNVIIMEFSDFMRLENKLKYINRKKSSDENDEMPYYKDIVSVKFKKGSKELYYKTKWEEDYKQVGVLKKKADLTFPSKATEPRGVARGKKEIILKNLVPKMQENRRSFWVELPENEHAEDLLDEGL